MLKKAVDGLTRAAVATTQAFEAGRSVPYLNCSPEDILRVVVEARQIMQITDERAAMLNISPDITAGILAIALPEMSRAAASLEAATEVLPGFITGGLFRLGRRDRRKELDRIFPDK